MKNRKGFLLVGVLFAFLFLLIVVPVMVKWIQSDTKISVKDQKASMAFSLAEAAIDRGYWKVKGSTATFDQITNGTVIGGYNFDSTYTDIYGGTYRIKIASGPSLGQVTIYGEGRDLGKNETRALQAIFTNTSVPGAILAGGNMTQTSGSIIHWGPIMAQGNITVATGSPHYPRKLAMQTVKPLDSTGDTNPPNTDSLEWWSNYNVPELPVFDFETMKASAAATGTLDCQGGLRTCVGSACASGSNCTCVANRWTGSACTDSGSNCSCSGSGAAKVCTGTGCTGPAGVNCVNTPKTCTGADCADAGSNCDCSNAMQCCRSTVYGGAITCDYSGSDTPCSGCIVYDLFDQTASRDKDYTWYWRNNVTWRGYTGIRGTVVAMGDLTILAQPGSYYDDRYCRSNHSTGSLPASPGCTVPVPPLAWGEYKKIDTASTNQYPGDLGLSSSTLTYKIGTSSTESGSSGGDLAVYGFLYVRGNFSAAGAADIYGALWVVGNVTNADNTMVFYNAQLKVPTLNVMLTKESWMETKPSGAVWP